MSTRLDDLKSALAGTYEIEKEVGQGGMANVYLARDIKHNRQVAVKVLRPELATALGPDRFLREIEIAANLMHPHILPLYDSGEADGFLFYVMPFVKGDTLRQRVEKEGELPIAEAVRIIREVVDALAFAHSQGVVHRDIKPDNVMISGRHALVTDFGVAKAVSEATGRNQLTTAGVALGTPTYMSPEQATADPHIDHRADIYSVGAMAYELLTGRPPFIGHTPQAVLAAHVTEQVEPVSKYRDQVSPQLEAVIMKCLAKKPADRWQTAEEMLPHLELLATSSGGLTPAATMPIAAFSTPSRALGPMILGVVAVTVIGIFGTRMLRDDPIDIRTSNIRQVTAESGIELLPAISPDGRQVAYTAGPMLHSRLYLRSLADVGESGSLALAGNNPGFQWLPAWTPDGQSVLFEQCERQCELYQVGTVAATPRAVAGGADLTNRAQDPDGSRFVIASSDSIYLVPSGGGERSLLTTLPGRGPHSFAWSPGGRRIAVVTGNGAWTGAFTLGNVSTSRIWVIDAGDGGVVPVTGDEHMDMSPQWLDESHLLFMSNRDGPQDIWVVEVGRGGPRGDPEPVTRGTNAHSFSLSQDPVRLAYSEFSYTRNVWSVPIDRSGPVRGEDGEPVTSGNQVIELQNLSNDGEWIAFDVGRRGNADIYKMQIGSDNPQTLTSDPRNEFGPKWSPDDSEIVFYQRDGTASHLWLIDPNGGNRTQITSGPARDEHPSWSPDGLEIAFMSSRAGDRTSWAVARESVGGAWSEPYRLTDFRCVEPAYLRSRPGFACLRSEDQTIVIVSPGGEVTPVLVLRDAGLAGLTALEASPDGNDLYFFSYDSDRWSEIRSVPVSGGEPRLVVDFEGSGLHPYPNGLTVGPDYLLLSIGVFESDIWVMDLEY